MFCLQQGSNQQPPDATQFSSNFVLIFNGQPGNTNVMKCRQVFYDFFGADISIVPQVGYSRVLLRSVPMCRDSEGNLPSSEVLASELANNQLCYDLTMFSLPHWLRAAVPDDATHSAVIITFLDEDSSRTNALLKRPIYMFSGACRAIKFTSLPLIKQCQ